MKHTHVTAHTRGHTYKDAVLNRDESGRFTVKSFKNYNKEYFTFDNLTPAHAKDLLRKEKGYLDPDDRQNNSPTSLELINTAAKHKGKLGGYVIPTESGRPDARVSLSTIYLPEKVAKRYAKKTQPDEFSNEGNGHYRLWWD